MQLITTLGPKRADELGMILPHEHVFVDLRTWDTPGYGEAEPADVVRLMVPEIEAVRGAGVPEATIDRLMRMTPFDAFARPGS